MCVIASEGLSSLIALFSSREVILITNSNYGLFLQDCTGRKQFVRRTSKSGQSRCGHGKGDRSWLRTSQAGNYGMLILQMLHSLQDLQHFVT